MFQTTNQIIINIKHPINVICPIPFLESRNNYMIKGSLGGETSVLRTFRMSGKELVKERVSQGKVS